MIITWPIVFAIIASIATICLAIFKILSARRADNDKDDIAKLDKKVAILETRLDSQVADRERLQKSVDRLADITYESLVKIAQEHSSDKK